MKVGPKKVLEPDPSSRNSTEGPNKCKNGPKLGQIEHKKDRDALPKNELKQAPKYLFEPDLDPKSSPKMPKEQPARAQKRVKEAPNVVKLKTKRQDCT